MHQHEVEASKGVCSRKAFRINEIKNAGLGIGKRQVAFFWDEQSAYDHETDRIDEIGLANLTNVLPGGQKAWERRKVERAVRKAAQRVYSPMEILEKHAGRLAFWMLHTDGGKKKAIVTIENGIGKWSEMQAKVTEFAWNSLFPQLLGQVVAKEENRPKLAAMMKPYGIRLDFVKSQHGCA